MGKRGRVRPKRILAALLAVVQLILLLPTVSIPALAVENVEYTRLQPEVAIYNAQTGIDEKLYNREISADSKFNAATKRSLFNLSFENNLVNASAQINMDNVDIGQLRMKGSNLQTSISASFHNYKHQHSWKSGLFNLKNNTANVTTAVMLSYRYWVRGTRYNPSLFINSRDMAKDTERLSTGYSTVAYNSDEVYFAVSLQGTYYDGGNKSCKCAGDASLTKPVITYMDSNAPSIFSVTGIDNRILKAGDEVELEVKFDEPIRFADDSAAHGDLYVGLAIEGLSSDNYPKAMLTKLDNDTLYFSYKVPTNSEATEKTITSVDFSPLMQECDLKVVFEDESFTLSTDGLSLSNDIGYTRATSYITDIAGNGMRESDRTYNVTESYIDTKAPALSKISATVTANNANIKAMTGSNDADNSDTHLGVGDSVDFGLSFSEVLDLAEGDYTELTATTNLRTQDGDTVTLTSTELLKTAVGQGGEGQGPSKGNVTYITLGTLTMEEGMTCTDEDGVIRIKSIQFNGGAVYDLAENQLSVTGADVNSKNTATLYLDVVKPEITTTMTPLDSDEPDEKVYAVIPHDYEDGSGFYVPFTIQDDGSGTNGLNGYFRWRKGTDTYSSTVFEYAVTSSTDEPEEWTRALMNNGYCKFTQVEGTQYLHIKQVDHTTYEVLGTELDFQAQDYAGNESAATFAINALWDNTYPTAELGEVKRELTGTGGKLTVKVNLKEATALNEARYLWTDSDQEPDAADINQVPEGNILDQTSATITITENVKTGEDFNQYLWIKVSDKNGNEVVYGLGRQRYNLGTIEYSVSTSSAYACDLDIYYSTTETDGFLLGLHPVPNTENEYYACTKGGQASTPSNWYKVYSEDRRTFKVQEKTKLDEEYLNDYLFNNSSSGTYSETFGYRTGDYQFYIIAGVNNAFTLDENGYVTRAGNDAYKVSEESYTIRAITPLKDGQKFFPNISITPVSNIPDPTGSSYYYYTSEPMLSTLEGLTYEIDLGEDTTDWNYDLIDFDRSYVSVSYGAKAFNIPLKPEPVQTITLPAGEYTTTGSFYLRVMLRAKNSGQNSLTFYHSSKTSYLDGRNAPDPSEFGITSLAMECSSNYYGLNYTTGIREQKVEPGGDVIYLPVSNETDSIYSTVYDTHKIYLKTSYIVESGGISPRTDQLIWNVTAGQTEDTAAIYTQGTWEGLDLKILDEAGAKEYVAGIDKTDPGNKGNAPLCLIRDTNNVIAVRAVLSNGKKSEIKYYTIYPSWLDVSGTISTEEEGVLRDDSTLVFTPEEGQSMEGVRIFARASNAEQTLELLPQPDGTYRCDAAPGFNQYWFHAVNSYGSIYYFKDRLDVYRDEDAPVITSQSSTESDGTYQIKFTIDDLSLTDYRMNGTIDLKLIFDEAYSQRLADSQADEGQSGEGGGLQATFQLAIDEFDDYWYQITPENDMEFLWEAEDVSSTGIYRVEAVMPKWSSGGYLDVTIYGAAKYLLEESEGAEIKFDVTVEATDKFGHTGSTLIEDITATNTKPHVVSSGSVEPEYQQIGIGFDYALMLPFNVPVQPEKSWILPEPTGYQTEWSDSFPVTQDGTTEISFYDIFGTLYTQELVLEDVFGDYGVELTISPETYTKEVISVTARMSTENTEKAFMFWKDLGGGRIQAISDANWESLPTKERTITRQENGTIMVYVYEEAYSRDEIYGGLYDCADVLTINIDNMVDGAPKAEPRFYFDQFGEEYTAEELREEFPDGIETTSYVEVSYKTSRYVSPTGDTGEKIRFTKDTGTSHQFTYVDAFGNEGRLSVNLAEYGITFAAPPEPYADGTAPTVVVDIYAKRFNNYTAAGAFSKDTESEALKNEFANIGYVQGYSLKVGATDYSSYKIVVLNSPPASLTYSEAVSDTVPGVSISGNTVTVSADLATDFTIAVVDNASGETAATADNFSCITIRAVDLKHWFDTTKPVAEQKIVHSGLYEQTVYVKFTDKADNGDVIDDGTKASVTLMNGSLERETTGEYAGWYKKVFKEDATEELLFQDHVGNMGDSEKVEITGIDSDPPTLTTTWTPPYISNDGQVDPSWYTDTPVNTSVYAHITSNKVLDVEKVKLTHYSYNGSDWTELPTGNIKDVENCHASYTVTSNGLTVCFEQGGIGLKFQVPAPNGKSTEAEVYLPEETIDKVVPTVDVKTTELKRSGYNVPYAVAVTMTPDKSVLCSTAGKADTVYDAETPLEVTITQNGTFEYLFVDEAGNRAVAKVTVSNIDRTAPKLTFTPDPAKLPVTNTDQTITVTVDEACTLTVDGQKYTLQAGGTHELSFSKNGVYSVIATDQAGNESVTNIPVGNIDRTPPAISFAGSTIRIRQDSAQAELTAALDAGVTAWEPESQAMVENWTYDASAVNLAEVGIYSVTYTARDQAGNEATAIRYVSVYDKNNPGIYLDGTLIEPEGTTVLKAGTHNIQVSNIQNIAPGVLEPYTVKISKGILTIGQIKNKRADVQIDDDGNFTITPGFYTVSVITQSRMTFRAILYVEA
ncbi:hypothetical protein B5G06_03225 [Flavonifractor sp. An52]|nr:hypothetical protein B5G06_03225 [Flavonifractor sp. An52]